MGFVLDELDTWWDSVATVAVMTVVVLRILNMRRVMRNLFDHFDQSLLRVVALDHDLLFFLKFVLLSVVAHEGVLGSLGFLVVPVVIRLVLFLMHFAVVYESRRWPEGLIVSVPL